MDDYTKSVDNIVNKKDSIRILFEFSNNGDENGEMCIAKMLKYSEDYIYIYDDGNILLNDDLYFNLHKALDKKRIIKFIIDNPGDFIEGGLALIKLKRLLKKYPTRFFVKQKQNNKLTRQILFEKTKIVAPTQYRFSVSEYFFIFRVYNGVNKCKVFNTEHVALWTKEFQRLFDECCDFIEIDDVEVKKLSLRN
jgi:hypothetical protein